MNRDRLTVFTGTANPQLAERICAELGAPLADSSMTTFSDGEIYLQINENVRGGDVFVVQPTCTPVDRNLMEALLMMDALRRASARRITIVLPYYGYARQDRKDRPRVPISAKLVASLLVTAGANRVLTLDLHAAQIQGFFDIPVDHLFAAPVIVKYLKGLRLQKLTVVSARPGAASSALAPSLKDFVPAGDYRQAPRSPQRRRGHARHRRRRGPYVLDRRRYGGYGRNTR